MIISGDIRPPYSLSMFLWMEHCAEIFKALLKATFIKLCSLHARENSTTIRLDHRECLTKMDVNMPSREPLGPQGCCFKTLE